MRRCLVFLAALLALKAVAGEEPDAYDLVAGAIDRTGSAIPAWWPGPAGARTP